MHKRITWILLALVVLLTGLASPAVLAQDPDGQPPKPIAETKLTDREVAPGVSLESARPEEGIEYVPPGWLVFDNAGTGGMWNTNDTFGVINSTWNVGGTGLSMAADADGSGIAWDTELWSPPIDLTTAPTATVEFASNFQDYAGNGDAYVDVSTDGGTNWTNIYAQTTDDPGASRNGGAYRTLDLTGYVGNVILLRWRYTCTSSTTWYWHIDNVWVHDATTTYLYEEFEAPPAPDLDGSWKDASLDKAMLGDVITYTVYISNSGDLTATSTLMTDAIPLGTTFRPGSLYCTGGMCWEDGVAVYWSGPISLSTAITVSFAVTATSGVCGVPFTNTAVITDPLLFEEVELEAVTEFYDHVYLHEGFEGAAFPPAGWYTSTLGAGWQQTSANAHSGMYAAFHDDDMGAQDDWLVTPQISLLPCMTNYLVFWEYNYYMGWYGYHGVWLTADPNPDPSVSTYVELAEFDVDVLDWTMRMVEIPAAYSGQQIYIAFRYAGDYSSEWYVDDVQLVGCAKSGLLFGPDFQGGDAYCPGTAVPYNLVLENCTGAPGDFDLTATGNSWLTSVVPSNVSLPFGGLAAVTATVEVPCDALPGDFDAPTIVAEETTLAISDTAEVKTFTTLATDWAPITDTLQGTRYHGLVYHDGALYQVGGETDWWVGTDQVNRYDVVSDSWVVVAPLLTPTYGIDAVSIGDYIYVPGGNVSAVQPNVAGPRLDWLQIYSPTADTWSLGASMPISLANASAVALDGLLYVIGGMDANGVATDTLYIYDPALDSWSTGAPMSQTRGFASAAAIDGYIYVVGGWSGGVNLTSLEIYDPVADSWSSGPDAPTLVSFGDGVQQDRFFLVYGGYYGYSGGGGFTCSTEAWAFDTATGEWFPLPFLARCLYGPQGDGDGERYWAVSGRTNEGGTWHMALEGEELVLDCPMPEMTVDAEPLDADLCPGDTTTFEVTVCNTGGPCPLEWMAYGLEPPPEASCSAFEPVSTGPVSPIPDTLTNSAPGVSSGALTAPADPEGVLWDQPSNVTGAPASQYFPDFSAGLWSADDFENAHPWSIETIYIPGSLWNGSPQGDLYDAYSLNWFIYADAGNTPPPGTYPDDGSGAEVWSISLPPTHTAVLITGATSGTATLDIVAAQGSPLFLPPGHYWLAFFPAMDFIPHGQFGWQTAGTHNLASAHFADPAGLISPLDWTPWGAVINPTYYDAAFRLEGYIGQDIPWLSTDPVSGTIAAGACVTVDVTLDSDALAPGDYYAGVEFASTDPLVPVVTLPVHMGILQPLVNVDYSWWPIAPMIDEMVYFTGTVVGGTPPFTYTWNFGDGTGLFSYLIPYATHSFASLETFTVSLTVEDVCGSLEDWHLITSSQATWTIYLPLVPRTSP